MKEILVFLRLIFFSLMCSCLWGDVKLKDSFDYSYFKNGTAAEMYISKIAADVLEYTEYKSDGRVLRFFVFSGDLGSGLIFNANRSCAVHDIQIPSELGKLLYDGQGQDEFNGVMVGDGMSYGSSVFRIRRWRQGKMYFEAASMQPFLKDPLGVRVVRRYIAELIAKEITESELLKWATEEVNPTSQQEVNRAGAEKGR